MLSKAGRHSAAARKGAETRKRQAAARGSMGPVADYGPGGTHRGSALLAPVDTSIGAILARLRMHAGNP